MEIKAIKTDVFQENGDLIAFILRYVKKISEQSVLIVTSKIVALAEGRIDGDTSFKNKKYLVEKESSFATKTKYTWLTIKDNTIMAAAGIDESNADGKFILLPKNSFASAKKVRSTLCRHFHLRNLGIIISDSGLLPLRKGVIGMARGYAGFQGLKSYKGRKDIFGKKFVYSSIDLADSLATAAIVCMGEGNECTPLALITEAPVFFAKKINKKELHINPKEDIFYPLLKNIHAKRKQK